MSYCIRFVAVALIAVPFFAGCSGEDEGPQIPTVTVNGKILYNGKPLPHKSQLNFATEAGDAGAFSVDVDKGGVFEAKIPPGELIVTISVDVDLGVDSEALAKMSTKEADALIRKMGADKFEQPITTKVTIEDKEGATLVIDLAKAKRISQ